MSISKIAIVGSSFEGYEIVKEIFGELELGKESSVILIPHICSGDIYSFLKDKKNNVYPIFDGQIIEPENIYVGMENPRNPSDSFNGIRRELEIEKENENYKFVIGRRKTDYIDKAFCSVSEKFKEKSIGVILYGIGDDGTIGMKKIKENRGMTLVQDISEEKHWSKEMSMPWNAIKNCEIDYVLSPNKLKEKLEEMLG